ncbi:MAG: ribonuclease P protein component, partial [Opitutaceae bacterium]|nr:ribonuclease P protein component [Opitutaceae bacterium]
RLGVVSRLGVVASYAAVGKAVDRVRAKRRLREVFRRNQQLVPPGYDIMLVARRSLNEQDFSVIEQKFNDACRRIFGKKTEP